MKLAITINNDVAKSDLAAYVQIVFDTKYMLENVKIKKKNDDSLYVIFPSKVQKNGTIREIFHPTTMNARIHLDDAILQAYYNKKKNHEKTTIFQNEERLSISSVNCGQYEKSNVIGIANIELSNCYAVKDVQIKINQDDEEYIDMPKYYTKSGYKEIFKPLTDEALEFNQCILNAFHSI